jgi:hypothetical protein
MSNQPQATSHQQPVKFARLFDLGFSQVLVTIEENDLEEYTLQVRTDFDSHTVCMSAIYRMREQAWDALQHWDEQKAILFRKEAESGNLFIGN